MQRKIEAKIAGIHLAGPNSAKTTLVIMTGRLGEGNLKIDGVYDRMGTVHRLFSDDRLFDVLKAEGPDRVMIDSPLTVPPCVACTRPACPGVDACEDIAVAYMQKLAESRTGKKRKKPMNPQTQRIWDVKEWMEWHPSLQEPTYSANKAPLVVRSMILQKRLNSLDKPIILHETSVPHALISLVDQLELERDLAYQYRAFGVGRERRLQLMERLRKQGFLAPDDFEEICSSVETFSAFVSGLVGYFELSGLASGPESDFFREQGWVYLPELSCPYPRLEGESQ